MNPVQTIKYLSGEWELNRTFQTFKGTSLGKCKGRASFLLDIKNKNHLDCKEKGTFFPNKHSSFEFHRSYYYSMEQGSTYVYFDRKLTKLFHKIDFQSLKEAKGVYYCSSDIYKMSYVFNERSYTSKCTVTGPNKNYTITTIFKKINERNGW